MELSSIDDIRLRLVKILVKCINNLCRKLDRTTSRRELLKVVDTIQIFENIVYKTRNSKIPLSQEEYIAHLTSIYHIMNEIFGNNE